MTKWWEDLTGQRGFNRTGVRRPPCSLFQKEELPQFTRCTCGQLTTFQEWSKQALLPNCGLATSSVAHCAHSGRISDLPRHLLHTTYILENSRISRFDGGKCYVPPLLHLRSSPPFPSLREPVQYARCPVRYPRAPDWSHCFRCNRPSVYFASKPLLNSHSFSGRYELA
jgi:hypothetical protein